MAGSITFSWNDGQVRRKLEALERDAAGELLGRALLAGALLGVNAAKNLTPVLTGTLRNSLHADVIETSRTRAVALVGTDVEYAPYVEFGTRHMAAQAYLRPGLEAARVEMAREIGDIIMAGLS